MNRLKAATIHLLISMSIIGLFLAMVYFVWYNQIYASLLDLKKPLILLVCIDVILGPLLTYIVFKKDKMLMLIDLSVIVLLQILAFGYGAYTCYIGKPTLLVMKKDSFEIIIENEINRDALPPELSEKLSIFSRPQYGYIPLEKIDIFKMAYMQQENVKALAFDQHILEERKISEQRVSDLLGGKKLVSSSESTKYSYYLVIHKDVFAILVVDQVSLQPVNILYTASES